MTSRVLRVCKEIERLCNAMPKGGKKREAAFRALIDDGGVSEFRCQTPKGIFYGRTEQDAVDAANALVSTDYDSRDLKVDRL